MVLNPDKLSSAMEHQKAASLLSLKAGCTSKLRTLVLLLMLPAMTQAQFNYVTIDGAVTVGGYTGPAGPVTIPDTLDGLPVIGIGYSGTTGFDSLTSVVIPNSVTNIDDYAFYGSNLRSVTIFSSSLRIGSQAFGACLSLTNVTINGVVSSIGYGAFNRCTSLVTFAIPTSVTSIEDATFGSCSSLAAITIPAGITNIGQYAFYECFSLTNVTLPINLTRLGTYAFAYCFSLSNVLVPASVASIGDLALYSCHRMDAITVDGANPFFSSVDGVLFDKSLTTLIAFPSGKAGSYMLPNGVNRISGWAFASCLHLTSVSVPDSVTNIGNDLFFPLAV
jgi:hypothetical protein